MFSIRGETHIECYNRLLEEVSVKRVVHSVPLTFRCHNPEEFRGEWVGVVLEGDDVVDVWNPESDFSFRLPTNTLQGYVKEERPLLIKAIPHGVLAWASEELIVKAEVIDLLEREFAGGFRRVPVMNEQGATDWLRFIPKRESDCLDRAVSLPETEAKYYDCMLIPTAGIWVGKEPGGACVRLKCGYYHEGLLRPVVASVDAFESLQASFGEDVFGECVFSRDGSTGKEVVEVLEDWSARVKGVQGSVGD